jgi:hypothetical protein
MSLQGDPRLMIAHWADEATRAENDQETLQARAHRSEDELAAEARARSSEKPSGLLTRVRGWARFRQRP